MKRDLRILMLEDSARDADLLERELRRGGMNFSTRRVETEEAFLEQLETFDPDFVISDYMLPSFDGMRALELVRERSPWLPFILVSGYIGEDRATEALKMGATDFILKDRLGRLVSCVQRSLREVEERAKRERLEERLRLFVESAPNAMVMSNTHGEIEMVNGQTERSFGYSRAELMGQSIEMLVPERFRAHHPIMRASFFASRKSRPMGTGRDLFGLRRDGTEFPVEVGLNPIATEEGDIVLSTIVDITPRRLIEQEKEQQRQELERSNADLESFAYVASHDLKAPLRAISHLAEWIEEDIGGDREPGHLRKPQTFARAGGAVAGPAGRAAGLLSRRADQRRCRGDRRQCDGVRHRRVSGAAGWFRHLVRGRSCRRSAAIAFRCAWCWRI